ncbi:MAG: hypothetical protein PHN72_06255 [Bacilli bacterium]|nr:hypothetical protein [Bacilli bacterium]
MKIKKNIYLITGIIIMFGIVTYSCYSFYSEKFSYVKTYNAIKKNCYEEKNMDDAVCSSFKYQGRIDHEVLEEYILNNNPQRVRNDLDVATVTSEIVEFSFFSKLQMFSPLIIIFIVIGSLHSSFVSGEFKNYLLREEYKIYLKNQYMIAPKVALIMPGALALIFLFACFFTNFNFNANSAVNNVATYESWKYNNFILYGVIICFIQFFISLLYVHIAMICIRKNKNKLVAIVMGYIIFIVIDIFIYLVIYVLIINKILGFKELTDYFNITGYWFFNTGPRFIWVLLLSFIFQLLSFIYLYIVYNKKEKLVVNYEKQI